MGELIFFGILLLVSLLESIARTRKQKRAEQGEDGEEAVGGAPPRERPRAGRAERAEERHTPEERRSAAEMLPRELWEELAGLAGGGATTAERRPAPEPHPPAPRRFPQPVPEPGRFPQPAPRPRPAPSPEPAAPPVPRPAASREPRFGKGGPATPRFPVEGSRDLRRSEIYGGDLTESHPIHQAHRYYGTDPSSRPATADPVAAPTSAHRDHVRSVLLGEAGPEALRRAFVLQEVLGRPVSMRGE